MSYTYDHPRPALTVDIVLFQEGGGGTEVLLIERGHPPFAGTWALPGGFVDEGEAPDEAALRELAEETGVTGVSLHQVGAFGEPGRDPRGWVVSVAYWARVSRPSRIEAADDAADAAWWPLDDLPPLAFDHRQIVDTARKKYNAT